MGLGVTQTGVTSVVISWIADPSPPHTPHLLLLVVSWLARLPFHHRPAPPPPFPGCTFLTVGHLGVRIDSQKEMVAFGLGYKAAHLLQNSPRGLPSQVPKACSVCHENL